MALRKIRGHQFTMPVGKIKLECLHEVLLFTIGNHSLSKVEWSSIKTNDVQTCIDFLKSSLDITLGPICQGLEMFLETTIAIINRNDYRKILSLNFQLFLDILSNLQLNENNASVSKCTVFKLPHDSPFILRTSFTTYYLIIEISRPFNSPEKFSNFMQSDLKGSKLLHIQLIRFIFMANQKRHRNFEAQYQSERQLLLF